jgi:L-fuconolactonase
LQAGIFSVAIPLQWIIFKPLLSHMRKIDTHVHCWHYDPVRYGWITEDMAAIRRDFLPANIQPLLEAEQVDGCVLVQVNQAESENDFFLKLAADHSFVKGIVGWVDLCAPDIEERLARYRSFPQIRGFRHILQGEQDRAYMLRPDFQRGIGMLRKFGFTYDLLIHADQLPYAVKLAENFPDQPFIIDHLAKPAIREQEMENWKKGMTAASRMGNMYCKLSGMVTEADWKHHTRETFRPYLDVAVDLFGTDRILFGSDWPVCLTAASYAGVVDILENYFSSFSPAEQEKCFSGNAEIFYGLSLQ